MPQRDDIDHVLVRALQDEPRLTNRALAERAGISTGTVATRLERLRGDHCLALTVLCDWTRAGYSVATVMFMRCHDDPRVVGQRLTSHASTHTVNVVLGACDLFVLVLERDLAAAAGAVDQLGAVPGAEVMEVDIVHHVRKMTLDLAPLPIAPWRPEELAGTTVPLDAIDHQIIASFAADGHQSNREVARRLGINETTIRSRVARLEHSGVIRLAAVADPVNLGLAGSTAMVTVRHSSAEDPHALERLLLAPGIAAYLACLGSSDAVVAVTAESDESLMDLIQQIRVASSARDLAAYPVVRTLKHRAHLTSFPATAATGDAP